MGCWFRSDLRPAGSGIRPTRGAEEFSGEVRGEGGVADGHDAARFSCRLVGDVWLDGGVWLEIWGGLGSNLHRALAGEAMVASGKRKV